MWHRDREHEHPCALDGLRLQAKARIEGAERELAAAAKAALDARQQVSSWEVRCIAARAALQKQQTERAALLQQLEDTRNSCAEAWELAREAGGGIVASTQPGDGANSCIDAAGQAPGTDAVSAAVAGTAE